MMLRDGEAKHHSTFGHGPHHNERRTPAAPEPGPKEWRP